MIFLLSHAPIALTVWSSAYRWHIHFNLLTCNTIKLGLEHVKSFDGQVLIKVCKFYQICFSLWIDVVGLRASFMIILPIRIRLRPNSFTDIPTYIISKLRIRMPSPEQTLIHQYIMFQHKPELFSDRRILHLNLRKRE